MFTRVVTTGFPGASAASTSCASCPSRRPGPVRRRRAERQVLADVSEFHELRSVLIGLELLEHSLDAVQGATAVGRPKPCLQRCQPRLADLGAKGHGQAGKPELLPPRPDVCAAGVSGSGHARDYRAPVPLAFC